ncbi:hypothetical protein ABT061_28810 [Streptosporangium sp. NPDC002544]
MRRPAGRAGTVRASTTLVPLAGVVRRLPAHPPRGLAVLVPLVLQDV